MKIDKHMTLVFIREEDKLLLAMKKRGFGAGRWNGYGGKVQEGETVEEAAIREMKEESTITIKELEKRGVINFHFPHESKTLQVHIFKILKYEGEAVETEEMKPEWYSLDEIPYDSMWDDDKYWLPVFLKGKKFTAEFTFDENNKVIEQEIKEK